MTKSGKSAAKHDGETSRASFLLHNELIHKLNHIALVEREQRNRIVEEALKSVVAEWEKQNGEITSVVG